MLVIMNEQQVNILPQPWLFFFLLEIYLIDLRIWNIFLILLTSPFVNMLIVICQYHVLVLV